MCMFDIGRKNVAVDEDCSCLNSKKSQNLGGVDVPNLSRV